MVLRTCVTNYVYILIVAQLIKKCPVLYEICKLITVSTKFLLTFYPYDPPLFIDPTAHNRPGPSPFRDLTITLRHITLGRTSLVE
jgi:hypothetical protein